MVLWAQLLSNTQTCLLNMFKYLSSYLVTECSVLNKLDKPLVLYESGGGAISEKVGGGGRANL